MNGNDDTAAQNGSTQAGDRDDGKDDVVRVERTPTSPAMLSQLHRARLFEQARGLGAGGTGAAIWRVQRITALALIPLAVWFMVSVVRMSTWPRADIAGWLASPVNAVLMALFIVIGLRHGVIGIRIVLEDYIASDLLRGLWLLLIQAAALVLGVAVVAALVELAVG